MNSQRNRQCDIILRWFTVLLVWRACSAHQNLCHPTELGPSPKTATVSKKKKKNYFCCSLFHSSLQTESYISSDALPRPQRSFILCVARLTRATDVWRNTFQLRSKIKINRLIIIDCTAVQEAICAETVPVCGSPVVLTGIAPASAFRLPSGFLADSASTSVNASFKKAGTQKNPTVL